MSRPPRLPRWSVHVVKASRRLTLGLKMVWLEDFYLDQGPEGAWISAANLAERLGVGKETVEKYRRALYRLGLHANAPRPGGRTMSWFATLPADCVPPSRASVTDCVALAQRLDVSIDAITGNRPAADAPRRGTVRPTGEPREELRAEILERDGHHCLRCSRGRDQINLVVDHIIPKAHGGKTIPENLQTLCEECNGRKAASLPIGHTAPESGIEPDGSTPCVQEGVPDSAMAYSGAAFELVQSETARDDTPSKESELKTEGGGALARALQRQPSVSPGKSERESSSERFEPEHVSGPMASIMARWDKKRSRR